MFESTPVASVLDNLHLRCIQSASQVLYDVKDDGVGDETAAAVTNNTCAGADTQRRETSSVFEDLTMAPPPSSTSWMTGGRRPTSGVFSSLTSNATEDRHSRTLSFLAPKSRYQISLWGFYVTQSEVILPHGTK